MRDGICRLGAGVAVLAVLGAVPAAAQENLDEGKSPAQLFASDCAICHKSPQALGKALRLGNMESFLRQHYTASRESAAAITAYLRTIEAGGPKAESKGAPKGAPKSEDSAPKRKTGSAKPTLPPARPAEPSSSDSEPSQSKSSKPDAPNLEIVQQEPKSPAAESKPDKSD
jgi:hypothetical protein